MPFGKICWRNLPIYKVRITRKCQTSQGINILPPLAILQKPFPSSRNFFCFVNRRKMFISKTLFLLFLLLVLRHISFAFAIPMNIEFPRAPIIDVQIKNLALRSVEFSIRQACCCVACRSAECVEIQPPSSGGRSSQTVDFAGVRIHLNFIGRNRIRILVYPLDPSVGIWALSIGDQSVGLIDILSESRTGVIYTFPSTIPAPFPLAVVAPGCNISKG